jgi:hypothetical protein
MLVQPAVWKLVAALQVMEVRLTQKVAANWLRVRGACSIEEQGGRVTGRGDEPLELVIGDGVTPFQPPRRGAG